ncbi:MAG TPA: glycosyltransferase, partial [Clostridia bacterium]|nr:glycosyltransferase [Clostridia bacterium]
VGQKDQFSRTGLYVGGTSLFYGTDILLGAFERLNETKGLNIRLILVCREGEGDELLLPYAGRPWLEVIHASGDEALEPIYRRSDFGIFSGRRDPYMDFSMPVKLFEYLSRALPIVTTDCVEAANFVEKNGVGIVAQDNPQSFAEAVAGLYDDPDCLPRLRKNAERALRGGNLWVHRAERAAQEIMQSRNLRS